MVVNFEFFGKEPIENVITCMHYKIDKVVYFGYHDAIQERKTCTLNFLQKYCGVQKVVFHELSRNDLQSVVKSMRAQIQQELSQGSQIYFDITGGESLILVAFGMLSKEFETPMHMFDVPKDELIELDEGTGRSISEDVKARKVVMNLERYIEMKGGVINHNLHKSIKTDADDEFIQDVERIWDVAKKYIDYWNPFSDFLRANMIPDSNLQVSKRAGTIINALSKSNSKLKTIARLNSIVDELESASVLMDVVHKDGKYRFRIKNQSIKECLWEGGSILELNTFLTERKESEDCMVGVHLDWDGVIHPLPGKDVLNEVDVLSLSGNVPTFISCKSGKMSGQQVLHALYELETVSKRFGGKYARKILVSAKDIGSVYIERASEMGIEVR